MYSFRVTAKKVAGQFLLVASAAVLAALGSALLEPSSVGIALPEGPLGVTATAVLAAIGRGAINMSKQLGRKEEQ